MNFTESFSEGPQGANRIRGPRGDIDGTGQCVRGD